MRRDVFKASNGFDPVYRSVYFEDTDLCFRLRQSGLRLLYEPRSRVRHVRTVSAPRSELRDVYAANHVTFMRRWGAALAHRPSLRLLQEDAALRIAARDFHTVDRILVLEDAGGADPEGAARTRRAARDFVSRHGNVRVTVLSPGVDDAAREDLLAAGVEVASPAEPDTWLESRPGHYSVVVGLGGTSSGLSNRIDETQPEAQSWPLERLEAGADVASRGAKRVEFR
jgi:hypothetical protein